MGEFENSRRPNIERWRHIDGFPYDVSDLGRVRRQAGTVTQGTNAYDVSGGRIKARPTTGGRGHLRVTLSLGRDRQVVRYVHQLVLEAFYGTALPKGYHTGWRNGDVRDNRLDNLVAWHVGPDGIETFGAGVAHGPIVLDIDV